VTCCTALERSREHSSCMIWGKLYRGSPLSTFSMQLQEMLRGVAGRRRQTSPPRHDWAVFPRSMARATALVVAQLTLAGLGCNDSASAKPGEPIAVFEGERLQCFEDLECFGGALEQTVGPFGQLEPVGAACMHLPSSILPVCECRGLLTRIDPPPGESTSFEVQLYPGHSGCSGSTSPGCLYCESEFPGCSVDDPTSCDAVCAEMIERAARDYERTYVATARLTLCETNTCHVVTEIGGRCYLGQPLRGDAPEVDCNLSDDELMALVKRDLGFPTPSYSCPVMASPTCAGPLDCSRGLACDDGVCRSCSGSCSYPIGHPEAATCQGDAVCASGELCTGGRCVPRANVECRLAEECAEGESCVLSGMASEGRGNAETRSFCQ
jgi:hypothetical protein